VLQPNEVEALTAQAASGDQDAKEILAALGPKEAPVQEPPKDVIPGESVPATEPQEGDKPASEVPGQVEQDRARDGKPERKPTQLDTIRDLRRTRREDRARFEQERQEWAKRLQALEEKFKTLPSGDKQEAPKEDELTRLLTQPGEFLSERDKRLIDQVRKEMKEQFGQLPNLLQRRAENDEARKIINSIQNFDQERDEDEMLDLLEADYGIDETMFQELVSKSPMKAATFLKKVWEKRNNLPAEKVADKVAASSGGLSAGKPVTAKPTMRELNDRYEAEARRGAPQEVLDAIEREILALYQ